MPPQTKELEVKPFSNEKTETPTFEQGIKSIVDNVFTNPIKPFNTKKVEPINFEEGIKGIVQNVFSNPINPVNPLSAEFVPVDSRMKGMYVPVNLLENPILAEQAAAASKSYFEDLWNDQKVFAFNTASTFLSTFTSVYDVLKNMDWKPQEGDLTSAFARANLDYNEENANFSSTYDLQNPILSGLLPAFLTGSSRGYGELYKSLGFMAGGLAATALAEIPISFLTSGVGTIPTAALGLKSIFNSAKSISKAVSSLNNLKGAAKSAYAVSKSLVANPITRESVVKNLARSVVGKLAEAEFEAMDSRVQLEAQFQQDYYNQNGDFAKGEDLEKIKKLGQQAHDTRYVLNMALAPLDIAMTKGVFSTFSHIKDFNETLLNKGLKVVGNKIDGKITIESADKLTSSFFKNNSVGKILAPVLSRAKFEGKQLLQLKSIPFNEGLEETYQYLLGESTNNYYTNLYENPDKINNTVLENVFNVAKRMYDDKELITSTEGIQSFTQGILGGKFGSIAINVAKAVANKDFKSLYSRKSKDIEEYENNLNLVLTDIQNINQEIDNTFGEKVAGKVLDLSVGEKIEQYKNGIEVLNDINTTSDPVTFAKLQSKAHFNLYSKYVKSGLGEVMGDVISNITEDFTVEQFNDFFKTNVKTKEEQQKYVEQQKAVISEVKQAVDKVNSTIKNKYKKGTLEFAKLENIKEAVSYHEFMSNRFADIYSKEVEKESVNELNLIDSFNIGKFDTIIKSYQSEVDNLKQTLEDSSLTDEFKIKYNNKKTALEKTIESLTNLQKITDLYEEATIFSPEVEAQNKLSKEELETIVQKSTDSKEKDKAKELLEEKVKLDDYIKTTKKTVELYQKALKEFTTDYLNLKNINATPTTKIEIKEDGFINNLFSYKDLYQTFKTHAQLKENLETKNLDELYFYFADARIKFENLNQINEFIDNKIQIPEQKVTEEPQEESEEETNEDYTKDVLFIVEKINETVFNLFNIKSDNEVNIIVSKILLIQDKIKKEERINILFTELKNSINTTLPFIEDKELQKLFGKIDSKNNLTLLTDLYSLSLQNIDNSQIVTFQNILNQLSNLLKNKPEPKSEQITQGTSSFTTKFLTSVYQGNVDSEGFKASKDVLTGDSLKSESRIKTELEIINNPDFDFQTLSISKFIPSTRADVNLPLEPFIGVNNKVNFDSYTIHDNNDSYILLSKKDKFYINEKGKESLKKVGIELKSNNLYDSFKEVNNLTEKQQKLFLTKIFPNQKEEFSNLYDSYISYTDKVEEFLNEYENAENKEEFDLNKIKEYFTFKPFTRNKKRLDTPISAKDLKTGKILGYDYVLNELNDIIGIKGNSSEVIDKENLNESEQKVYDELKKLVDSNVSDKNTESNNIVFLKAGNSFGDTSYMYSFYSQNTIPVKNNLNLFIELFKEEIKKKPINKEKLNLLQEQFRKEFILKYSNNNLIKKEKEIYQLDYIDNKLSVVYTYSNKEADIVATYDEITKEFKDTKGNPLLIYSPNIDLTDIVVSEDFERVDLLIYPKSNEAIKPNIIPENPTGKTHASNYKPPVQKQQISTQLPIIEIKETIKPLNKESVIEYNEKLYEKTINIGGVVTPITKELLDFVINENNDLKENINNLGEMMLDLIDFFEEKNNQQNWNDRNRPPAQKIVSLQSEIKTILKNCHGMS